MTVTMRQNQSTPVFLLFLLGIVCHLHFAVGQNSYGNDVLDLDLDLDAEEPPDGDFVLIPSSKSKFRSVHRDQLSPQRFRPSYFCDCVVRFTMPSPQWSITMFLRRFVFSRGYATLHLPVSSERLLHYCPCPMTASVYCCIYGLVFLRPGNTSSVTRKQDQEVIF